MGKFRFEDDYVSDVGYLSKATIVTLIAILAGIYHDIYVFKYAINATYIALTIISLLICLFLIKDKAPSREQIRPFVFIALMVGYVITKTYFISYIYAIAAIQCALLVAMFLNFELKKYLAINIFLFVSMLFAIQYNGDQAPVTVIVGNETKYAVLQFYTSVHLFIILLYTMAAYPKIKAIKAERSFSELGKSTSFLLHELSRPIQKLQNNLESKDQSFLNELIDTLELAKILRNKDYFNINLETFDIAALYREIIKDYESFIPYFEIKYQVDVPESVMINGNTKFTKLILCNLIRNAIEALKEVPNKDERNMHLIIDQKQFSLSNNCLKKVDTNKIFDPGYTTKKGNMGVGLFLTNTLCEKIGWKLVTKNIPVANKNSFSVTLLFS